MEDIYSMLLGNAPDDATKLRMTADMLRKQKQVGQLGMLSGDKTIAPVGNQLSMTADAYAGDIQNTRRANAQATGLENWRKMQSDQWGAENELAKRRIKAQERGNELDYMSKIEAAQLRNDLMREKMEEKKRYDNDKLVAQLGGKYSAAKIPQLDYSVVKLNNTLSKFKSAKEIPGVGYMQNLPLLGTALSSKEGKDVKSQIQAVKNDLLNAYSGMAVTIPEDERRSAEQEITALHSVEDFVQAWPRIVNRYNSLRGYMLAGYSPEVQQEFFSNNPNGGSAESLKPSFGEIEDRESMAGRHGASGSWEAPAGAAPKRIRVDAQGNVIGN